MRAIPENIIANPAKCTVFLKVLWSAMSISEKSASKLMIMLATTVAEESKWTTLKIPENSIFINLILSLMRMGIKKSKEKESLRAKRDLLLFEIKDFELSKKLPPLIKINNDI